jgi:hypothetical protein
MSTHAAISPKELPDWMRQARRDVDWGAIFVLALSLLAAWPFLLDTSLPHTNASENYVYRTADYAAALLEGRLYPRWSPNAFSGYGAPIPHYLPPGAAYTAAVLQVLLTNDAVIAVRLIYVGAFCLAGAATYTLVIRRSNAGASIIASALYLFSPYLGLVAPHVLGDFPGVVAMALLPTMLWAVDRLLLYNRTADMLFTALAAAALLLTHVPMALTGFGLALALVIWQRGGARFLALAALLLGIGLASFYWVPAILDMDAIHWQRPFADYGYRLSLAGVFAPVTQLDMNELVPAPQFAIGWVILVFAIAGGICCIAFRSNTGFQRLFLLGGILLLLLGLFVFPAQTSLLGPITLCLSIGASAVYTAATVAPLEWKRMMLPTLLVFIWIGSSPVWLSMQPSEPFGAYDARSQIDYEQQGFGIAVLPPDSPVPSTLPDNLPPNRFLVDSYRSDTINKIAPGQFSSGVQLALLAHTSHSDRYQIQVTTPTQLNILTAYFPGWTAAVAGTSIPLRRVPETGLIQIDLPRAAGEELSISLGATTVWTAAWAIAWISGLILAIFTWARVRRGGYVYGEFHLLTRAEARLMLALLILLTALTVLLNRASLPVSLRLRPGYKLTDATFVENRTDSGLSLLAYQLDSTDLRPASTIDFSLYWQTGRLLSRNYQTKLYLLNTDDGSRWSNQDFHHPHGYPTERWTTGKYVSDRYQLDLSPAMPPGNYQLAVEANDCLPTCDTGTPLTFFDATGRAAGPVLLLPPRLTISR